MVVHEDGRVGFLPHVLRQILRLGPTVKRKTPKQTLVFRIPTCLTVASSHIAESHKSWKGEVSETWEECAAKPIEPTKKHRKRSQNPWGTRLRDIFGPYIPIFVPFVDLKVLMKGKYPPGAWSGTHVPGSFCCGYSFIWWCALFGAFIWLSYFPNRLERPFWLW